MYEIKSYFLTGTYYDDHYNCSKSLEPHSCKLCGTATHLFVDLHRSKTDHRSHKCSNCDFTSFSFLLYLRHVYEGCLLYTCTECSYKTHRKSYLCTHRRRQHSTRKLNQCIYCPYKNKNSSLLQVHILSKHTSPEQIQWFTCELCPYRGRHKDYLRKHMTSMHQDKSLECNQCPFRASSKYSLKEHKLNEHSLQKTYKCDFCPFSARWQIHLTRHVAEKHASPDKIQWFECEQCEYRAKRKDNLKQHVQARHVEVTQWFECECGFRTKWKKNMKLHKERTAHHCS